MKILGIDSSGLVASVALVAEEILVGEFTVNNGQTHSQTLLPMLDKMMRFSGMELSELDAIAVAAGPGSFTGLRIGSSTAKGLGMALDKPIVPVPTLAGLAYRLAGTDGVVCPLLDARRNQVYTALYAFEGERLCCLREQAAVDVREIIEEINRLGRKVMFLGDGVPVHREALKEQVRVECRFAPVHLSRQSAASVAALGSVYFAEGRKETAAEYRPIYLRESQAERERRERLSKPQEGKSHA